MVSTYNTARSSGLDGPRVEARLRDGILSELIGAPAHPEVPYGALMPRKIRSILLVSSLYDYHTFIEDGTLSEMLYSEFLDLNLRYTPSIERVSTAEEALEALGTGSFDLVISMVRVGDMDVQAFGEAVHRSAPDVPVTLLACNPRELGILPPVDTLKGIDSVFVWLGDVRIFLAIIKHVEDHRNAQHDAMAAGVRSIILVEDSVQFYSSYLPMLYTEIFSRTQALAAESMTRAQRTMRLHARPKVLLARTYEQAMGLYDQYRDTLLGVIADAAFPREGSLDPAAGFRLVSVLKDRTPDLPVLIQSDSQNAPRAAGMGVAFVDKNSPRLLGDLRDFMQHHLGFGDFVFVDRNGAVITKAPDLRTLEWALQAVPEEDLLVNVARKNFSTWLVARTEFELTEEVQELVHRAGDNPIGLREQLLDAIRSVRARSSAGVVVDFSSRTFEGGAGVVRIGKGSLGGKGRGLAFINSLINTYHLEDRFPGVRIVVPPTAVLATGTFDRFMDTSGLLPYALTEQSDGEITRAFLDEDLPADVLEQLWEFLQWVRYPLAVRSSSLLEDASYQPFAGIYKTYMIPNNDDDPEVRLEQLSNAIKSVYASTYHADPKAYMESLPNRLEEEKMAVVVQQVVGRRHGSYVYPDFAGVGRSMNFYPMPGMRPEDGVVSVALGMGKTVVEGGRCVRFCPAYPRKPIQSFTPEDHVENSQRRFLALDLSRAGADPAAGGAPVDLASLGLEVAEEHGTLGPVASVYSPDNDAVYDGLSRSGIRLVTMAGVLKGQVFPLADVTAFLLRVGAAAWSCQVEIEFAVRLSDIPRQAHEFAFLQIRPLVHGADVQDVTFEKVDPCQTICVSHRALGNGVTHTVRDLVYVRRDAFDRASTPRIAAELGEVNAWLRQRQRPYVLVGPGRWGSADPWLGIPVKWAHISGVRCIIETGLEDVQVDPSQGSHFFQNITSFGIAYLTVDPRRKEDFLDGPWLDLQPFETETTYLRHLVFERPMRIAVNGRINFGVVTKPSD